jgi:hypothetical protein
LNPMSTTQTRQLPGHEAMIEGHPTDPMLAAVLQGKPAADEIPLAAWWLLAESLSHSVIVRRATERVEIADAPTIHLETKRAWFAAVAALEQLKDPAAKRSGLDAGRVGCRVGSRRRGENPTVRATTRELALLIVSHRTTPIGRLRAAILAHLDALRLAAPTREPRSDVRGAAVAAGVATQNFPGGSPVTVQADP